MVNKADIPEKTLDELSDDERSKLNLRSEESVEEEIGEIRELMLIMSASVMLARLVEDNKMTLWEYEKITDELHEYHKELDVSVR